MVAFLRILLVVSADTEVWANREGGAEILVKCWFAMDARGSDLSISRSRSKVAGEVLVLGQKRYSVCV